MYHSSLNAVKEKIRLVRRPTKNIIPETVLIRAVILVLLLISIAIVGISEIDRNIILPKTNKFLLFP